MANGSDAAAWAALIVAAFAMFVALGQMSQQYASSGQLIRLCDTVVYGGRSGLPGRGRRVWSWSQLRFRVQYEVPIFRLPRGKTNLWDIEPLPSVRFTEHVDTVANDKHWSALSTESRPGEASWVSFCRKIKYTCHDRVIISLKHDDADRVPPELPNIPVPVSLRDVIIMAFSIGLDCTEASFTRRSLGMQGACGVITSSNHQILGLVIHFMPHAQTFDQARTRHWKHWVARLLGGVPIAIDVLPWNGKNGLTFYEYTDDLLRQVLYQSQHSTTPLRLNAPTADPPQRSHKEGFITSRYPESIAETGSRADHDDSQVAASSPKTDQVEERLALQKQVEKKLRSNTRQDSDSEPSSIEQVAISKGECPQLKWYWISQINVFEGHFASPWRDELDSAICSRAFGIILGNLVYDDAVGLDRVQFPGESITSFFAGETPVTSHPPFAVNGDGPCDVARTKVHPTKTGRPPLLAWHYYPTFDCVLPEIAILAAVHYTSEEFGRTSKYSTITNSQLFVVELMRFDHWLHRAAETEQIFEGRAKLLRNTPAVVQYILQSFYPEFKYCYRTGHDGEDTSQAIRERLAWLDLSAAEITFLTVALLRTLRYAFCLGSGLNTKPALQILWHDLAAHMV